MPVDRAEEVLQVFLALKDGLVLQVHKEILVDQVALDFKDGQDLLAQLEAEVFLVALVLMDFPEFKDQEVGKYHPHLRCLAFLLLLLLTLICNQNSKVNVDSTC